MSQPEYLKIACPHCGGRIAFPSAAAGTVINCPHCQAETKLVTTIETGPARLDSATETARPEAEEIQPAGFWLRVAAKLVDLVFGLIGVAVVAVALSPLQPRLELWLVRLTFIPQDDAWQLGLASFIVCLPLAVLAQAFFLARFGGTPGKLLGRLEVADANGGRISFGRALFRSALELVFAFTLNVLFFQVDYLLAAFAPDRRTFHDRLAGTSVVRKPRPALSSSPLPAA